MLDTTNHSSGFIIMFKNANTALNISISAWAIVALIGQWFFAIYVLIQYALPLATGNEEQLKLSGSITGYALGDTLGNAVFFSHVIPAALLSIGGIIQLLPFIRKKYPVVHRWNGRMFLSLGIIGAISGLYLTWGRGSRLSDIGAIGITLNGMLILVAASLAWRFAKAKQFAMHKRWAIHAFILINGVWFFRLNLMAWYAVNQGPNGNNSKIDGPMDIFLSFACYGIPMLIAEFVFWAKRQNYVARIWTVTALVTCGAVVTLIGVGAAIFMMWLPRISLII